MLTAHLEKLILQGKASYNTFVAGGSSKHVLNVDNDRFIIITDLTYFSQINSKAVEIQADELSKFFESLLNTQIRIFSRKSFNQYLFRNTINAIQLNPTTNTFLLTPAGGYKLDTYLVHESDVSFTFSIAGARTNIDTGVSEADSIASPPPYDYGKDGQVGAVPVRLIGASGTTNTANAGQYKVDNTQISLELSFPVDAGTIIPSLDDSRGYPILQVGYVEIFGNPTNIQATL